MRHKKGALREDGEEGRRTPTNTRRRRHQEGNKENMIMTKKIPTTMKNNKRNEYAGNHMNKIKMITAVHKDEKEKKMKNIYDIEKFNKTNKRLKQSKPKTERGQRQDLNMFITKRVSTRGTQDLNMFIGRCPLTREVRARGINQRQRYVIYWNSVEGVKGIRDGLDGRGGGSFSILPKQEPIVGVRNLMELVRSIKNYDSRYVELLKLFEGVKCIKGNRAGGGEGPNVLISKPDSNEEVRNILGLAGPNKNYDPG